MLRSAVGLVTALGIAGAVVGTAASVAKDSQTSPNGIVVHEWGTFTTVAGPDGRAIDWLPLSGPTDLPCFVEHYQRRPLVKLLPTDSSPRDYATARATLRARVRMETPVVYFYSPRDTTVSVTVRFHHGLMTEWFPHANVTQTLLGAGTLHDPNEMSTLEWPSVRVAPSSPVLFPQSSGESRYYAARNTDAAPLSAYGQHERFLFYRGVADFDVPLAAAEQTDGSIRIQDLSSTRIPNVVVFERHGDAIGFREVGPLSGETTVPRPALTGTVNELRTTLVRVLTDAGLKPREAVAMVETWRDSWFEEGTRVFYLVPRVTVDGILPLEVRPAPDQLTRVFVGRMDVITERTEGAVRAAIAGDDRATLERYGRFLGPITDRLVAEQNGRVDRARIRQVTDAAFASYLARSASCRGD